jgi:hypothetical protein
MGIMEMPGDLKFHSWNKEEALRIINGKKELFIASVKGHIPKEYYNEFINFPPIIRNVPIVTNKETIGEPMYQYMVDNNIPTDKTERKLTQLMDTHNEYMTYNNYYLWFLMDTCHFVIDDVKEIYTFTRNTAFKPFVEEFMRKRIESKDKASNTFYKICLNGAYGYDIMNTEKYAKISILDDEQTFLAHLRPNFVCSNPLSPGQWSVQTIPKGFSCDTCLIEGFFTLDNAKFWYLNFIYNFLYKCLDRNKIHFIEGDTDSMYWAVSGNLDEPNTQGFKHIIKDHDFYNKNVYKFLPADFYSSDNSNPKFDTQLEKDLFRKKLGGLELEKQSDGMTALASKLYTTYNVDNINLSPVSVHAKGVKLSQNNLKSEYFQDVLNKRTLMKGVNNNLQLHNGVMSKIHVTKNILTAVHTKYKVSKDFSTCSPLFIDCVSS